MAQMLELSDREFKITTINMLRAIKEKIDINNIQKQMSYVSREIKKS